MKKDQKISVSADIRDAAQYFVKAANIMRNVREYHAQTGILAQITNEDLQGSNVEQFAAAYQSLSDNTPDTTKAAIYKVGI